MTRPAFLVLPLVLAGWACTAGPAAGPLESPANLEEMDRSVREQFEELRARAGVILGDRQTTTEERAAIHGEIGLWYQAYGYRPLASEAYSRSLRLLPGEPRWHFYLGILRASTDEADLARRHFQAVLERKPDHLPSLVRLAEVDFTMGRMEAAAAGLERALGVDPGCVRARFGLAGVRLEQGETGAAIDLLETAREQQPEARAITYVLGMAYRRAGEIERSVALLALGLPESTDAGLRMEDRWFSALTAVNVGVLGPLRRARAALRAGDPDSASSFFRIAVERDPAGRIPRLGLARALLRLKRVEEAGEELGVLTRSFPGDPEVEAVLGDLRTRQGETESAAEHYRRSLRSAPDHLPSLLGLAEILISVGEGGEALTHLEAAHRSNPASERALFAFSSVLVSHSRHREALEVLESAGLRHRTLDLLLAWTLATAPDAETRDAPRALESARRAFEKGPSLAAAEVFAAAVAASGDYRSAARLGEYLAAIAGSETELGIALAARARRWRASSPIFGSAPLALLEISIFVDPGEVDRRLGSRGGPPGG